MRLGFAKREITPPRGIVLGGYAGFRPCGGVHDPLYCKAVVLEQGMERYCLVALDLLCPEEAYEAGHYEAMAAIVARGGGEKLIQEIQQLRCQLQNKH